MADPTVTPSRSARQARVQDGPAAAPSRPLVSRAELAESFSRAQNITINNVAIEVYDRLIEQRVVNTYGDASGYSRAERERAMQLLNRRILDNHGPAVFITEVRGLLGDPEVRRYLTDLRQALATATPQNPVNLWTFTVGRAGSEREATRWIATLLQDYTPEVLQGLGFIRYVDDARGQPILLDTLKAVAAAVQSGALAPYPPGSTTGSHSNIFYHYYVPRYLAQRLVDEGVPRNLAFLTAGTFNLEYEMLAPALLDQRHDGVLVDVAAAFSEATGVSRAQLDARVQELRRAGSVNNEFMFADLELEQDLGLTPAQREALLTRLGERFGMSTQLRTALAGMDTLTLHRITQAVTATQFGEFLRNKSVSGLVDIIVKPGYAIYQNGVERPVLLTRDNISDAYNGFSGAAAVLPDGRMPFPEQMLTAGLLRMGPKPFMTQLYRRLGPTAGDALAARLTNANDRPGEAISAIAALYRQDATEGRAAVVNLLQHQTNPRALAKKLLDVLPADAPAPLLAQLRGAALVGLEPPERNDANLARLTALVGRTEALVPVAIIDQGFNSPNAAQRAAPNRPRAGVDLIDNDADPFANAFVNLRVQHGTPVMDLATRGSPLFTAIPIRSRIDGVATALDHAARNGARVVNISQEMVAASAADLEVFRAALRRHPDMLVVMAAGNRGQALGAESFDLAAIDEPNFVKVAAATADGRLSRHSSYSPRHVQFVARGDTMNIDTLGDPFVSRLYAQTQLPQEATSHAGPTIANAAARVRLLAPHLTAAQVTAVLAQASDSNDGLAPRSQFGVTDPRLAAAIAATLTLVRSGEQQTDAVRRASEAAALSVVDRQRLTRAVATLTRP